MHFGQHRFGGFLIPFYRKVDIEDEHIAKPRYWKPYTLSVGFLSSFAILTLLLLIAIELLIQYSNKHGALVFADTETREIPKGWSILFNYFPTAAIVLYGLLWTWIDHDVKRMEPYFLLSRDGGAKAEDSLLMDYPYSFIAAVPFVAAKKKHWPVFFSGIILLLIFWLITPAISALFSTRLIQRTIPAEFFVSTLIPTSEQEANVTTSFAYLAYEHVWLNASLPAFTNESFAILPFDAPSISDFQLNETWSGKSVLFSADLSCASPDIQMGRVNSTLSRPVIFSNAKDCTYNASSQWESLLDQDIYGGEGAYMGWSLNSKAMSYMATPGSLCPREDIFVALWGKRNYTEPVSWNPLFCEMNYNFQDVIVTVEAGTKKILSYEELSEKQYAGTVINTTVFERFLFTNTKLVRQTINSDGLVYFGKYMADPYIPLPRHFAQLSKKFANPIFISTKFMDDAWPEETLLFFGLAGETDLGALLNPQALAKMLSRAFRLVFAFAVTSELSVAQPTTAMTGSRTYLIWAIVLNQAWARVLEAALLVLLVLNMFLTALYWNRRCNLGCEPGSLASHIAAITNSKNIREGMEGSDCQKPKDLAKRLVKNSHVYYLRPWGQKGHVLEMFETPSPGSGESGMDAGEAGKTESEYNVVHPIMVDRDREHWELGIIFGSVVTLLFFALIVLLAILYSSSLKYGDLPRVSANEFVHNLVFSYLPTAIATFVEPFWVLVTRYVCLVMPFQALRDGFAPASSSLSVNYNSKPPHFVLYRSLRVGNFLLAALALMTLLANLLAVAFGGLFYDLMRPVPVATNFTQSIEERVTYLKRNTTGSGSSPETSQPDMFYIKLGVIASNMSLPSWVTPEYYFLPFSAGDSARHSASRRAITRGFGSSLECTVSPESQINLIKNDTTPDTPYRFILRQPGCGGAAKTGYLVYDISPTGDQDLTHENYAYNTVLLPFVYYPTEEDFANRENRQSYCGGYFATIWTRVVLSEDPAVNQSESSSSEAFIISQTPEISSIICQARLNTGLFSVEVDNLDRVISYELQGDLSDAAEHMYNITGEEIMYYFERALQNALKDTKFTRSSNYWTHLSNDQRPETWVDYLRSLESFPEIKNPYDYAFPPDPNIAARTMEELCQALFAIYLHLQSSQLFQPLPSGAEKIIEGEVYFATSRVGMSPAMVYLSMCILALFTITAVFTYSIRPGRFLNYPPTTIAAKLALVYDSPAIDEAIGTETLGNRRRDKMLKNSGRTYGYGWFKGRKNEGKPRRVRFGVGVEPLIARGRGTKAKGLTS